MPPPSGATSGLDSARWGSCAGPSAATTEPGTTACSWTFWPTSSSRRPMPDSGARYYQDDLALVHHRGFGFHADMCAPGIVALLAPVRERSGLVVELGCGSGLLTRHLVDAGHRVVATDASPAMLQLARQLAPDAEDVRRITLPDDPIPPADAIVGVGH